MLSCIDRNLYPFYNADIWSILNASALLLVSVDGLHRDISCQYHWMPYKIHIQDTRNFIFRRF